MTGPVGRAEHIGLYLTAADRDAIPTWREGDIAYSHDIGYAYYDGARWLPFGVQTQQLAYVETTTDVIVPAGPAVTIVSATGVDLYGSTKVMLTVDLPEFEFTNTNGGEAIVRVRITPGQTWDLGHCRADRQMGWPLHLTRRADVQTQQVVNIDVLVDCLSGGATCHAGTDVGAIALRVLAQ